jgi:hypothetical protein
MVKPLVGERMLQGLHHKVLAHHACELTRPPLARKGDRRSRRRKAWIVLKKTAHKRVNEERKRWWIMVVMASRE